MRTRKVMEPEGNGDTNHNWCPWNNLKELQKETCGIKDLWHDSNHPDHGTAVIS